ncbi:probable N-acetyltransferase CML1 [Pseudophryne corroboree]|uniref:probable N-acetyltransferase CML1 n=1 Tax=Pseudophryne corroboree TaxID=495146 RepID=UPI00308170FD
MSTYNVRLYKDSDFPAVRRIFIGGCQEHTTAAFHGALMVPRNWLLLLVVFVLPLLTIGSILLSILDVLIVLILFWLSGREFFHSYGRHALVEDLKDITRYYLQREGYGFWVVESAGEVVGMVAAVPSYLPGGEKHMELRRMSVASTQRGKGIAKILCRTLIDFARKKGCDAVILSTTTVQVDALKLYEKMGFRCAHTMDSPKFTDRLARITWVIYKYDIKKSG